MSSTGQACPSDPPRRRASTRSGAPSPTSLVAPRTLRPHSPHSHSHLWSLPDGTGLHAPYGELVLEARTGRICCHLCGRWYVSLGSHIRAHGHTAESYRLAMGLCRTRRLIAEDLSRSIATRQARAYRRSPAMRARLAAGQELSRTGQLTGLARAATRNGQSPERVRIRSAALEAGRAARAAQRQEAVARRLDELGADNLTDYLRREYAAGASLRTLAKVTGLGWATLRQACDRAGIEVRSAGATSGQQQRQRARAAAAEAARGVGTDDLIGWLRAHRDAGWSLARLAHAVGHSAHWVRSRIPDQRRVPALAPPPSPDNLPGRTDGAVRTGRAGT